MLSLQRRQYEIVELARTGVGVTRPMVAKRLGLSLPTVSVAVRELLDQGILKENGFRKSRGGRRARVITLNPDFAYSVGLSASMSGVRGVICDLSGRIVVERNVHWAPHLTREGLLSALYEAAGALLEAFDGTPVGIGVGISGLVRMSDGVSIHFPYLEDWSDVPVGALLAERFGLDVFVENDVNASTLAELRFGKGCGVGNFLYVYVGKGIGLGIVVNGALYRGASGNAGELGHVALGPNGLLCQCGNYGCLETVAGPAAVLGEVNAAISSGAISSLSGEAAGAPVTMEAVLAAAEAGDRLAENVVIKSAEYIGRMTGNLANLFDPELIVMGGLLAKGSTRVLETLRRVYESTVLPSIAPTVALEVSETGDLAGALGAADVVFQNFISGLKSN